MASPAQHLANAANARFSTGPRTETGKAHSAQNARTHGLTAAQLVIPCEDREEFEELQADYQIDLRPRGILQQDLFDQMVASAWKMRRILRMETELCSTAKSYTELLDDDEIQKKLDRLARHDERIHITTELGLSVEAAPGVQRIVQPMYLSLSAIGTIVHWRGSLGAESGGLMPETKIEPVRALGF